MPPHPQRHREVERAVAPPPLPEPPPLAIAAGTAPAPVPSPLPSHRAAMIGKLTAEYRAKVDQFKANTATLDRLNAENAAIRKRLSAIDAEIRVNAWDGEPLTLIL